MNDPTNIVEAYLRAWYAGDAGARAFLADAFHFSGPGAHFHSADVFLRATGHVAAGLKSLEIEKLFAAGDEVAAFYTLHLHHRVASVRVAERFRLADGLIVSSTLIMDTAPFRDGGRATADKAIDPVCGMEVDKAAPAATAEHQGTLYYFCSKGCAASFTADPTRYLAG